MATHDDRENWATRHPQWKVLPLDDGSSTGLAGLFSCVGASRRWGLDLAWGLAGLREATTGPRARWSPKKLIIIANYLYPFTESFYRTPIQQWFRF